MMPMITLATIPICAFVFIRMLASQPTTPPMMRVTTKFVDAWSNNFAYIGHRATGTAGASFLLTDRDDRGGSPMA